MLSRAPHDAKALALLKLRPGEALEWVRAMPRPPLPDRRQTRRCPNPLIIIAVPHHRRHDRHGYRAVAVVLQTASALSNVRSFVFPAF